MIKINRSLVFVPILVLSSIDCVGEDPVLSGHSGSDEKPSPAAGPTDGKTGDAASSPAAATAAAPDAEASDADADSSIIEIHLPDTGL